MISPLESVARAIFRHNNKTAGAWDKLRPSVRRDFMEQAKEAVMAFHASAEMQEAGFRKSSASIKEIWDVMRVEALKQ